MSTEKRSGTVLFLGKRAGRLTESEEGYVFRYEAKFLEDPGALPISVTLPLRKEPFLSRELHPFFDGLLPEGWTLEHVARNRNLDPEDRMDLLLACCRECVGAVSIGEDASSPGEDNSEEDSLGGIGADEVPPAAASHPDAARPDGDNRCLCCCEPVETGLAHPACSRRLFGTDRPPVLDLTLEALYRLAGHALTGFVPGVQPKMSLTRLFRNGRGTLTLRSGQCTYLAKPQVPEYRALPENEALTMAMAAAAGIETAPCGLLPLASGELCYVTLRMDRLEAGKEGLKPAQRPMEDFCQATEHPTRRKYKGSMELVARTLRRLSDDPGRDLAELLRRTLFIFLSGNADMHLKNFSFLQDGHTRRLAPAYDLLSTRLVISERDDPEELALPLNGKKNRLKREDFALFARNIGLNDRQFQAACDALAARLPVLFDLVRKSFLPGDLKEAYGELLRERSARLGLAPQGR